MILEGPDGSFGSILSMGGRGNQLNGDVFVFKKLKEPFGAFVVENVHLWLESFPPKFCIDLCYSGFDSVAVFVEQGNSKDSVSVIVVNNEYVLVSVTGHYRETSSLVTVDPPLHIVGHVFIGGICVVGSGVRFRRIMIVSVRVWGGSLGLHLGGAPGGSDILSVLVHVAHRGGDAGR